MTTRFTAALFRARTPRVTSRDCVGNRRMKFMCSHFFPRLIACLFAFALAIAAPLVRAAFEIEELYSNADGTVQYLVLQERAGSNGLQGLHLVPLISSHAGNVRTYFFTNDLPSSQTANKRVLVATQGFAALGIVVPDYIVPNQFFPTDV